MITLGGAGGPFGAAIKAAYDDAPRTVDITTSPTGIPVTITYHGSTTAPTIPGTYHVVVTADDPNYAGSSEGTLVLTGPSL